MFRLFSSVIFHNYLILLPIHPALLHKQNREHFGSARNFTRVPEKNRIFIGFRLDFYRQICYALTR